MFEGRLMSKKGLRKESPPRRGQLDGRQGQQGRRRKKKPAVTIGEKNRRWAFIAGSVETCGLFRRKKKKRGKERGRIRERKKEE